MFWPSLDAFRKSFAEAEECLLSCFVAKPSISVDRCYTV